MLTIWKFPLEPGRTDYKMPKDAKLLTVQMQGDTPMLWAMVEPTTDTENRAFEVYGTGQLMPSNPGKYVATFQMVGGSMVWHVFESPQA